MHRSENHPNEMTNDADLMTTGMKAFSRKEIDSAIVELKLGNCSGHEDVYDYLYMSAKDSECSRKSKGLTAEEAMKYPNYGWFKSNFELYDKLVKIAKCDSKTQ